MPTHHLDLLRDHQGVDSLGRSLYDRAAGRFYTPEPIGMRLARTAVDMLQGDRSEIRVVDPFCGDGRLVTWVLDRYAASGRRGPRVWDISLWDANADAAYEARERVSAATQRYGVDAVVRASVVDTFAHAPSFFGAFDIVVTNPPWDVLKPDKRELAALSREEADRYIRTLRAHADDLAIQYPTSIPRLRFSGWGINLARAGVEVALRLTAEGGACGVVSPASLLADQASGNLRGWLLSAFRLLTVDYYPAEARLFDGVDQPAIAFVAVPGVSDTLDVEVSRFGPNRDVIEHWRHVEDLRALEPTGFALPIHVGALAAELLDRVRPLPRFRDLESRDPHGLWAGRELDETDHHSFLTDVGPHPFTKGRMIARYRLSERPTQSVDTTARPIPASSAFDRIAWRDVSRPSQRRRVQATVIPKGWVTGNSLSVTYFRDASETRLKALLAVLNSAVFEYQVRAHLATAHVSLSTVRLCHVPRLDKATEDRLARLVDRRLGGDESAEDEIDRAVASAYGVLDLLAPIQTALGGSAAQLEAVS